MGTPPPSWLMADSSGENIAVALAVITLSPFDTLAVMLSLVPVPIPSIRPPFANFADLTVLIAVAMLAKIVATVVAIAAMLPGNGTDCAWATPAAMALPVLMAISASANTFESFAKSSLLSPIASNTLPMPPAILA